VGPGGVIRTDAACANSMGLQGEIGWAFVDLGAELSKKVWSGRRTCRATAPDTGRIDTICFGYGLPVGTRVSTFKVC
jgi:hypothetical protein